MTSPLQLTNAETAATSAPELGAAPRQPVGAIAKLCIALAAISFAPIFIRLSENELSATATVFNRLPIFLVVFGLGQFICSCLKPTDPEAEPLPHSRQNNGFCPCLSESFP